MLISTLCSVVKHKVCNVLKTYVNIIYLFGKLYTLKRNKNLTISLQKPRG